MFKVYLNMPNQAPKLLGTFHRLYWAELFVEAVLAENTQYHSLISINY